MQWVRNLCRFCGQIGGICYNIFEPNTRLEEKVKKCLSLQISEEDFKPKEICSPCYNKINDFIQFIDLCISTSMKFDSIYYADGYSMMSGDKNVYDASIEPLHDHSISHKQSVIITNRQSMQYQELNKEGSIVILQNCSISQPDAIDFNVHLNNMEPAEVNSIFTNSKALIKGEKEVKILSAEVIEKISVQNQKSEEQGLVLNGNLSTDFLDSLESEVTDNIVECAHPKNVTIMSDHVQMPSSSNCKQKSKRNELISVEEVKKALESQHFFNKMHKSEIKKDKSYSCPHCEKIFKRRINLTAHISVHTNIRCFKCSNCPKTFAVKCHLTQHNKTHSELFKCHICQKRFQVPSKLSRHMQIHSTNKPFLCSFDNCNKAFSDKHNLKQHILSHTAVKNISCNICEKLFKTRKNLNAHIKNHISEKVYQCKYCEKIFRYKHNLKTHIVKHGN